MCVEFFLCVFLLVYFRGCVDVECDFLRNGGFKWFFPFVVGLQVCLDK